MEHRTESVFGMQGRKIHPGRTAKRKKNFKKRGELKYFGQHEA